MENIIEKIRKRGYKITRARQSVLMALTRAKRPLSAREIGGKIAGADLVSIYRSLAMLKDLELVHAEIYGREEKFCLAGEPHHHIICEKCGYTESFRCDHKFGGHKNFTGVKHRLTLTGICRKCSY
ncbi:MAG: transcriptional repressor [Candidatus Falkowbacteria bacterium]